MFLQMAYWHKPMAAKERKEINLKLEYGQQ